MVIVLGDEPFPVYCDAVILQLPIDPISFLYANSFPSAKAFVLPIINFRNYSLINTTYGYVAPEPFK